MCIFTRTQLLSLSTAKTTNLTKTLDSYLQRLSLCILFVTTESIMDKGKRPRNSAPAGARGTENLTVMSQSTHGTISVQISPSILYNEAQVCLPAPKSGDTF